MGEIRFSRKHPWCCPQYKDFYIKDTRSGTDIYGHDAWDYALFRRIGFRLLRTFRTRKKAYEFVARKTGLTRWDMQMGSYAFIANERNILGILKDGTFWRIEKRTRPVRVLTRPEEDEQLTGWFPSYRECLQAAKDYLESLTT